MLAAQRAGLIKDIEYLRRLVLDSTDIEEFEDFLEHKNEVGSTLQAIKSVIDKEFLGGK